MTYNPFKWTQKQRDNAEGKEEMPDVQPIPPPMQMSDEIGELRRRLARVELDLTQLQEMLTRKSSVTGEKVLSSTGKQLKKYIFGNRKG